MVPLCILYVYITGNPRLHIYVPHDVAKADKTERFNVADEKCVKHRR